MDKKSHFSFAKRLKSFVYALRGIGLLCRHEHNAWIHLFATCCVLVAGVYFHLSTSEWVAVLFAIGLVLAAEAFNSAIEVLANHVTSSYSKAIRNTKDLAAGAVLLTAITALIIGLLIFIPKLL